MSTDDRMETITDRAAIRDSDEPDERTPNEVHVDESGCSCKTGPYRGFQRDPIDAACPKHGGPLRHGDGDVTVCHPDGSTTIIREPDERGDFPFYATPAPVGAAVALDLDALGVVEQWLDDDEEMRIPGNEWGTRLYEALKDVVRSAREPGAEPALVSEVRRLTRWQSEALLVMVGLQALGSALGMRLGESITGHAAAEAARALTARAESAEAEVVTLRAKVAAAEALAEKRDVLYPPKWAFGAEENYCNGYRQARADFIAAMATGEGQ